MNDRTRPGTGCFALAVAPAAQLPLGVRERTGAGETVGSGPTAGDGLHAALNGAPQAEPGRERVSMAEAAGQGVGLGIARLSAYRNASARRGEPDCPPSSHFSRP